MARTQKGTARNDRRNPGEQHAVPRPYAGNCRAGFFDYARALMTEDYREHNRKTPRSSVVVNGADADRLDPDDDLVVAWVIEVNLLNR